MIQSLDEMHQFARDLIASIQPSDSGATVICLEGDLGAGKTTLTQMISKELSVETLPISPTFVLQKQYSVPESSGSSFISLVHIDAYRLETGDQMKPLRFSETLTLPRTLVIIEWPEQIASVIPEDSVYIRLVWVDETTRRIEIVRLA